MLIGLKQATQANFRQHYIFDVYVGWTLKSWNEEKINVYWTPLLIEVK